MAANTGPTRNELRRLQSVLDSEEYGPKLVRLNKSDQRTILDLISDNKGKEARARIVELDEQRRSKRRPSSEKTAQPERENINDLRDQAFANLDRIHRSKANYNETRVKASVYQFMDKEQLRFAITTGPNGITDRIAAQIAKDSPGNWGNVFYYH